MSIATGTVVGTGAAINVSIGFTPLYVRIINAEDGDTIDEAIYNDSGTGMDAGTSITTAAAAATRASNGISQYAGSDSAAEGFTIGSGISEADKTLHWLALG